MLPSSSVSTIYSHPHSASQCCPADHPQRQHKLSILLHWNGWLFHLFSFSNSVSEFDAHQKVERLLALLTFVEKSINGDTVRKDWRNWNIGRVTIYETHEFDGDSITQGIITEIYFDHAILTADDMHLWIDDDTQFMFR